MDIIFQPPLTLPQTVDVATACTLSAGLRGRYGLRQVMLGNSVMGRPIHALVLPTSAGSGAQRVLMAAAFHAQEWLTALCALRLCEDICRCRRAQVPLCGVDVTAALQEREIWLLPMVNPDGVEIALHGSKAAGEYAAFVADSGGDVPGLWQANVRGVDINHNFNAGWEEMQELAQKSGTDCPGPRRYSGPVPESEPETRAVTDLCRQYTFRHVVALHSQGEEIYWQFGEDTPPQSHMMAQILGAASGYAVASPEGMAAYGGFKDWFIRCFRRPGFTIELGLGTNPLPVEQFEDIYCKAREMLVLSLLL